MARGRVRPAVATAFAALLAGCGLGPGPSSEGTATLTVTRDYGAVTVLEAGVEDPDASETALRMLDRAAEIETRYGGGFVQSIEGLSGGLAAGRRSDWFFYVNGIESPVGSADRPVAGGDHVWWDHHDWTDVMRVPAVVGAWPEPFLQASAGEPLPVRVECAGQPAPCETAVERLAAAGVEANLIELGEGASDQALRVLVGAWPALEADPAAAQIADGPTAAGVFARFEVEDGRTALTALDERAEPAARLGAGAGLVAAVRDGELPPAWVVSGVDAAGVMAAADSLDEAVLKNRYAVAVGSGATESLALPVVGGP